MEKLKGSVTQQNLKTSLITKSVSVRTGDKSYLITDHSKLKNLDYEHSGHVGFASDKDLNTQVTITDEMQIIPAESLEILKKNTTAHLLYHDNLYGLSVRANGFWTYTYIEKSTGEIKSVRVDMTSGAFDISSSNPVQDNLDTHINNTSVHLQSGERAAWNNKVSAEVNEEEEKLIFISEV